MKTSQCPVCNGKRLQPVVLAVKVLGKSIIDVSELSIERAAEFFEKLSFELTDKELIIAQPIIKGIGTCGEVVPGMKKNLILHAGPPITWDKMSGPMRGAVIGGLMYEGLAGSQEEAEKSLKCIYE